MLKAEKFISLLVSAGYTFYTGVPCSFFKSAINRILDLPKLKYIISANEGSALATCAGAYLAGHSPVLMIQNSGLGNIINPLTSLHLIYKIPCLIFISGRAFGIPDEPQHEIMGKQMQAMLQAVGIPFSIMPQKEKAFEWALESAANAQKKKQMPYAFIVRKGTLSAYERKKAAPSPYPMTRFRAIEIIAGLVRKKAVILATTGMPARELFTIADSPENFYMQGSMGHAPAIALGAALNQSHRKFVILDGDGAILMHLGILSTIGHYKPKNLIHIVLDNEAYESTGNQDTVSSTSDFSKMAAAAGYTYSKTVTSEGQLRQTLNFILKKSGPSFLRVKINRNKSADIPRITSKYSANEITQIFKNTLRRSQ